MEQSPSSESNQEVSHLVKKFPTFYGTWRFITMITRACHLSLSGARSICAPPHYYTSWRSVLMLSSHLCIGLPSGLFPYENPVCTTALLHTCHMLYPSHMHLSNIWTGVQIRKFIMQSPSVPWYLASLRPKYLPQLAVLGTPSVSVPSSMFHTHIKQEAKLWFCIY